MEYVYMFFWAELWIGYKWAEGVERSWVRLGWRGARSVQKGIGRPKRRGWGSRGGRAGPEEIHCLLRKWTFRWEMLQRIFLMFSGVSGTFVFSFPGNFIHINCGCFPVGVGFLQGTALQPWPQGEGWQPNQTGLQYCFFFFFAILLFEPQKYPPGLSMQW